MPFLSAYILFMYVCMYVWLCWVLASVRGPSPAVASGGHSSSRCRGHSSSRCAGLSPSRPLAAEHRLQTCRLSNCGGPSRSAACGILPDQGSNPCPLHWQADSQPLRHQGSPKPSYLWSILLWKKEERIVFSTSSVGQLDICMQKNEAGP